MLNFLRESELGTHLAKSPSPFSSPIFFLCGVERRQQHFYSQWCCPSLMLTAFFKQDNGNEIISERDKNNHFFRYIIALKGWTQLFRNVSITNWMGMIKSTNEWMPIVLALQIQWVAVHPRRVTKFVEIAMVVATWPTQGWSWAWCPTVSREPLISPVVVEDRF